MIDHFMKDHASCKEAMKPYTVINLIKRITTKSDNIQGTFILDNEAAIPVLVLPKLPKPEQKKSIEAAISIISQILKVDIINPREDAEELTDDLIRAWWKGMGGDFHGPKIEYATIEESKFLPLMRSMLYLVRKEFKGLHPETLGQKIIAQVLETKPD